MTFLKSAWKGKANDSSLSRLSIVAECFPDQIFFYIYERDKMVYVDETSDFSVDEKNRTIRFYNTVVNRRYDFPIKLVDGHWEYDKIFKDYILYINYHEATSPLAKEFEEETKILKLYREYIRHTIDE